MARPQPRVIEELEDIDGNTWQVLEGDETYLITYQGKPVSIRVLKPKLGSETKSYKRMSYTELGTCIAQVRRYNANFNTTDFDYIKVFRNLNVNQK